MRYDEISERAVVMSRTYDMTEGKVSKHIFTFYFPLFMTNLLQQVYTIADTAIVGKGLGDTALGAVGNMSSLTFFIIGFSVGLTNGFSVSAAQSFGAKKYNELRKSVAASVELSIIVSVLLTFLSIWFLRPVMNILQTPENMINDSLTYGYIIFGGLAVTISYNLFSSILRALGDSRTPFTAIVISTIVNMVLNCFFIFVLNTGVGGPAAATVISQGISAVICFAKLRKLDIMKLSDSDFRSCFSKYPELLKNGIPMAAMNSITAVGCMVVQYFVNDLGEAYISAYSVCSKYINFFMQPALTAGLTMSAFTSQNYGAGKYDRIRDRLKVCVMIAMAAFAVLGTVMIAFPRTLAGFMLNGEYQITLAAQYLPICGAWIFAVDLLFVFRSGCQGMGYPLIPMISGILEMVIRITVIVLFIDKLGFKATAWADAVAWIGALTLNFTAFNILLNRKLGRRSGCGKYDITETVK